MGPLSRERSNLTLNTPSDCTRAGPVNIDGLPPETILRGLSYDEHQHKHIIISIVAALTSACEHGEFFDQHPSL